MLDWNPHANEVNLTLLLGYVGIDKSGREGAGTVLADLCVRVGLLDEHVDGDVVRWLKSATADERRIYGIGDAKTNANVASFLGFVLGRDVTLEDESLQMEVFIEVFSTIIMMVPGDWHTGLNMLQSIYSIFWNVLLEPLKDILKIGRVSKDVRNCYYQASKLVQWANVECNRYLTHNFAAAKAPAYAQLIESESEGKNSHAKALGQYAIDFDKFISEHIGDVDERLSLGCVFVRRSNEFLSFVEAYRCQDSFEVELGYHRFSLIFKMLGQHTYHNCALEQVDMLQKIFPYSRQQECRINRGVRTYPGSTERVW